MGAVLVSTRSASRRGEPFYFWMAAILLGVVLGGFSSSFYLRDSALPPLPADIVAHGTVTTLWFILILFQSALISLFGRPASVTLHRRLGLLGVLVALGVVGTGIDVAIEFYRRGAADIVVPPPALLFANLVNAIGFGVCFAWAVVKRGEPESHKRFMTWASVVIIGPASFRLVRDLGFSPIVSVPAQLLFCALLFAHDRRRLGRFHVSAWVGLGIVLLQIVGSFTIGQSGPWVRLAESLFGP